jgi:hypothetical protein
MESSPGGSGYMHVNIISWACLDETSLSWQCDESGQLERHKSWGWTVLTGSIWRTA